MDRSGTLPVFPIGGEGDGEPGPEDQPVDLTVGHGGNMQGIMGAAMSGRGIELFDDQLIEQRMRLDRRFSKLMLVQWVAAIVVAVVYSPIGWAGKHQEMDGFLTLAFLGGAALSLIPMLMVRL